MIHRKPLLLLLSLPFCITSDAAEQVPLNGDLILAKSGQFRIPAGTYILHHTATLRGMTHVVCAKGAILSDDDGRRLAVMIRAEGEDISIDGCEIVSHSSLIMISPASHTSSFSLTNNYFHGLNYAHGIWIDSPDIHHVTIVGNKFDHLGYGVGQNVRAADMSDVRIEKNTFSGLSGDGVELNNPVTSDCCGPRATTTTASFVIIRNNVFTLTRLPQSGVNAGFCVGIAGAHDVVVESNHCSAWNEGIHVEDRAYRIRIQDNQIETNDEVGHPYESGIQVIDGHEIEIERNTIGGMGDGIHIDYDPTHQVRDIKIIGNRIIDCRGIGITVATGSLGPIDATISGNTITGCKLPIYLIGRVIKMTITQNSLGVETSCPLNYAKGTQTYAVEVHDNVDAASGKPLADCASEYPGIQTNRAPARSGGRSQ